MKDYRKIFSEMDDETLFKAYQYYLTDLFYEDTDKDHTEFIISLIHLEIRTREVLNYINEKNKTKQ